MGEFAESASTYGAEASSRQVWLAGQFVSLGSGSDWTLPADQWLDCRQWAHAYLQFEFVGTGGGYLTAQLQTAVASSASATAWGNVTSASTTLANDVGLIKAPGTLALPPAGVLRIKFSASGGSVSGVVRVLVCFKQAA